MSIGRPGMPTHERRAVFRGDRGQRLRRSLLFVSGSDERRFEKALASGADTVILDLEDAVAPSAKEVARQLVVQALARRSEVSCELAVRVNGVDTPFVLDDVRAVVRAGCSALVLPKADGPDVARFVDRLLACAEREAGRPVGSVPVLAIVETAAGVTGAEEMAKASPRIEGLCFGHADFCLDLGLEARSDLEIVEHARRSVVLAARAARVTSIDRVWVDVRDAEGFRADAARGFAMGYAGKLCIHPAQVLALRGLEAPSHGEVARARRLIAEWEKARAEGRSVATFEGSMIDAPIVEIAERILARADRLK